MLNDRKLRGESAIQNLVSLYATLKQHPTYKAHDVSWFKDVPSGIQLSAESELRARKEAKSLPYEALVDIAEELHKQRAEAAKMGPRKLAVLVHNELLLRFLLVMVWRQLNIRKCRLGSNLFKDTISPFASMVVPRWVKERIKINPREKFWQYHFREKETKTAHEVRSVLPRRLVPLLEEFLEHHRPILLQGPDPGTLFMNKKNGPLTAGEVGSLVGELTLKYGKKRVTPHRFRDAFAYWWLDQHPEDYLTVSKKLWHRNIQTTSA